MENCIVHLSLEHAAMWASACWKTATLLMFYSSKGFEVRVLKKAGRIRHSHIWLLSLVCLVLFWGEELGEKKGTFLNYVCEGFH